MADCKCAADEQTELLTSGKHCGMLLWEKVVAHFAVPYSRLAVDCFLFLINHLSIVLVAVICKNIIFK